MKYRRYTFLFILVIWAMPLYRVYAQGGRAIQLKQEQVSFTPKSFYINDVTDSIPDSLGIGTVTDAGAKQKLTIKDGTAASLKNFIDHNITQDRSVQAIVLNVVKIDIDVKKKGASWAINAAMSISFYAGNMKLVEYNGKGHAETSSDPAEYAERFIRQTIEQDMSRFDGWWQEHKNEYAVSDVVKVNVTIAKTMNKPDCIVYSIQRPLRIADFGGPVHDDVGELAATYSGTAFSNVTETQKGQLVMNLTITPYFEKKNSWFKEEGKTSVLLAHEQTHFDITAIKACELAEAIRKTTFTKDNYLSVLEDLRKKYTAASNEEQNTYDNETSHGTIPGKQLEWQKKITQQVKESGCY